MKRLAFLALFIASPALSQQQQATPSQLALQINTAVANMAQEIEQSREVIKRLTDRVKELEAKYEPPKEQKKD